jgi:hypothetical protein
VEQAFGLAELLLLRLPSAAAELNAQWRKVTPQDGFISLETLMPVRITLPLHDRVDTDRADPTDDRNDFPRPESWRSNALQ